MGFVGDFFSGLTYPFREVAGGVATTFGADPQKTREFLGISDEDETAGFWDTLKEHPGKLIGEALPYLFIPETLAAKGLIKAGRMLKSKRVMRAGQRLRKNRLASAAVTFGGLSAIEESLSAQLHEREAHPFIAGATVAGGMLLLGKIIEKSFGKLNEKLAKDKAAATDERKRRFLWRNSLRETLIEIGLRPDSGIGRFLVRQSPEDMKVALEIIRRSSEDLKKTIAAYKQGIMRVPEHNKTPTAIVRSHEEQTPFQEMATNYENVKMFPEDVEKFISYHVDDSEAFLKSIGMIRNNIEYALRHLPKDSQLNIIHYLDTGKPLNRELTDEERQIAREVRKIFDTLIKETYPEKYRKNYFPHYYERVDETSAKATEEFFELIRRRRLYPESARFKERSEDAPPFLFVEEETGGAIRPKTTDLDAIVGRYAEDMARVIVAKRLADSFPKADKLGSARIYSFNKELGVTGEVKLGDSPTDKIIYKWLVEFVNKKEPKKVISVYVHPEVYKALKKMFDAYEPDEFMKGVIFVNAASKRALLSLSLFHLNALAESAIFAGIGNYKAIAIGTGIGAVVGGLPGAIAGATMGNAIGILKQWKLLYDRLAHSGTPLGDAVQYAMRYVEVNPPRDVMSDEFYIITDKIDEIISKFKNKSARKIGKALSRSLFLTNKAIDIIMWHRFMFSAKIVAFYRLFENMKIDYMKRGINISDDEIARKAGQIVNDMFGGQNFRKLAEETTNKFEKRIYEALASESGRQLSNILLFAPDWTISNIRVIAKAFPGIEKDPVVRKQYALYAIRGAVYVAVFANLLQWAFTGKTIFENDDPTKIDLGDGRVLVISKQLFEPFDWIEHPVRTAMFKQGSLLKTGEELLLNKQYLSHGAPNIIKDDDSIVEAAMHVASHVGSKFVPIAMQSPENGTAYEHVLGMMGHPVYHRWWYKPDRSD